MTKKESEKDSDRPHYYSQFWLDVAAGRRVIGTPRTDEGDADEGPEPMVPRRPARSAITDSDGYNETVVHPQVEPEFEEDADEYSTPDLETFDDGDEISDEEEDIPVFGANEDDIPDVYIAPKQEEDTLSGRRAMTGNEVIVPDEENEELEVPESEEEEFFDDEEDDEDEDDSWTARGRKKPKPGRQVKLPSKTPSKRAKREPRRGF